MKKLIMIMTVMLTTGLSSVYANKTHKEAHGLLPAYILEVKQGE